MRENIIKRVREEAEYIIEHKATVRDAAAHFGISKSTVHTDVTVKLKTLDYKSYKRVRKILEYNFSVRHIRGGEVTKLRFARKEDRHFI